MQVSRTGVGALVIEERAASSWLEAKHEMFVKSKRAVGVIRESN